MEWAPGPVSEDLLCLSPVYSLPGEHSDSEERRHSSSGFSDSYDLCKTFPRVQKRSNWRNRLCRRRWRKQNLSGEGWTCYSLSTTTSHTQPSSKVRKPGDWLEPSSYSGSIFGASCGSLLNGEITQCIPGTGRNPNKAVLTVDALTTQILVANDLACALFGYSSLELIGKKLSLLIPSCNQTSVEALGEEHLDNNGHAVVVPGRVVDAVTSSGEEIPVSLWVRKMRSEADTDFVLVLLEAVEGLTALVRFTSDGWITSCDVPFAQLYGYALTEEVAGCHISDFIPSIQIPSPGRKMSKALKLQRAVGLSREGTTFPLSLKLRSAASDEQESQKPENMPLLLPMYAATIWVFTSVSGLITLNTDATIYGINNLFALTLFGYNQEELLGKPITCLMPGFYDYMDTVVDSSIHLPSVFGIDTGYDEAAKKRRIQQVDGLLVPSMDGQNADLCDGNLVDIEAKKPESSSSAPMTCQRKSEDDVILTLASAVFTSSANGMDDIAVDSPPALRGEPEFQESGVSNWIAGVKETNLHHSLQREYSSEVHNSGCSSSEENRIKKLSIDDLAGDTLHAKYNEYKALPHSYLMVNTGTDQNHCLMAQKPDSYTSIPEDLIPSLAPSVVASEKDIEHIVKAQKQNVITDRPREYSLTGPLTRPDIPLSGRDQNLAGITMEVSKKHLRNTLEKVAGLPEEDLISEPHCIAANATSTPVKPATLYPSRSSCSEINIREGNYVGSCYHRDGSRLSIRFQVMAVELADTPPLFCVWVLKDLIQSRKEAALRTQFVLSSLTSSHSITEVSALSLGEMIQGASSFEMLPGSEEPDCLKASEGDYANVYTTLRPIGKGAFGSVWTARRKEDEKMAVVKFILKEKILEDCWLQDPDLGRVTHETSILSRLQHPNIVKGLVTYCPDEGGSLPSNLIERFYNCRNALCEEGYPRFLDLGLLEAYDSKKKSLFFFQVPPFLRWQTQTSDLNNQS